MNKVQRNKARAKAESMDKLKKDIRNGIITKAKAKGKKRK